MNNITSLQSNIAGFDFSTLSAVAQNQVLNLLKQITTVTLDDILTNANTTSDQVTSIFSAISTVQVANKTALQTVDQQVAP